jgi:hypothetical protein
MDVSQHASQSALALVGGTAVGNDCVEEALSSKVIVLQPRKQRIHWDTGKRCDHQILKPLVIFKCALGTPSF